MSKTSKKANKQAEKPQVKDEVVVEGEVSTEGTAGTVTKTEDETKGEVKPEFKAPAKEDKVAEVEVVVSEEVVVEKKVDSRQVAVIRDYAQSMGSLAALDPAVIKVKQEGFFRNLISMTAQGTPEEINDNLEEVISIIKEGREAAFSVSKFGRGIDTLTGITEGQRIAFRKIIALLLEIADGKRKKILENADFTQLIENIGAEGEIFASAIRRLCGE